MFARRCSIAIVCTTSLLGACGQAPTTSRLAEDAIGAMGGADLFDGIEMLVREGSGTRARLGQPYQQGDSVTIGELSNVVETLDLPNQRAALEYDIQLDDFMQHRLEVLTRLGEGPEAPVVGYGTSGGRPLTLFSPSGAFSWGPQNSPEFLLRRNLIGILRAAAASEDATSAEEREFNGRLSRHVTLDTAGEEIELYFDSESGLLNGFETLDTETMLGDVRAQYILQDYREVDGLRLPHWITILKDGQAYSDVRYTSISINEPGAAEVFAIPGELMPDAAEMAGQEHYARLTLNEVAPGVYHAVASSHHSMVVEFPGFVVVVEAPYTEAQSIVLARAIESQFPEKPIRYAAVTHPHYDHTGGVRAIAGLGATVVVTEAHAEDIGALLDAPHTNPPDQLERYRASGQELPDEMEIFGAQWEVNEGDQSLELYAISDSPHVDPMVLAYVPGARVLFQSDIWFPGTGGPGTPEAAHLLSSIRDLGLDVETMVGGHGDTGPFSELVSAIDSMD
jgi:glyoxylase-like metal-dependent hydrolase (beta-lactamase superfamily II)